MEGDCGFFHSDRSVALSLKKERKDLVKAACFSVIWERLAETRELRKAKLSDQPKTHNSAM